MARRHSATRRREQKQVRGAIWKILAVVVVVLILAGLYARTLLGYKQLDPTTLCPANPTSVTVLLVDVTDPMNLPQRQDFNNQLERLLTQIPRYGKLVVMKVDPVSDQLLAPVITKCNPGSAADVSELNSNPQKLQKMHSSEFIAPVKATFRTLLDASGAPRSPILESIQSVNLTELQQRSLEGVPKRLVVASDLLQHTDDISFYRTLPDPDTLLKGQAFSRTRTDLRGVEVELWMLQRTDSTDTQPRALPDLWDAIITEQGGQMTRLYTVSG